jgi:acetoin:2,6-dichlorophenolindophenol oxidoreductase subunit alpha
MGRGNALSADELLALYRTMLTIRRSEEALRDVFAAGEVPGFIHLSIGQEAVAAGVIGALRVADTVASTHRGHGHAIAKGVPLPGFFAEILGREQGVCRGRGGSMHVADMAVGMLGANGIVGAGLSIALGSAIAHRARGAGGVAVACFGDGALAEGIVHETFNLAALWRLPLLLLCENNGWGEFLPTSRQIAFRLVDLAAAYRIPHQTVDGNDVEAVALAARAVLADLRGGGGPAVLECLTTRVRGHFEGDAQKYRTAEEHAEMAGRDPLPRAATALRARGVADGAREHMEREVAEAVAAALAAARASGEPDFAAAFADVTGGPAHG